MAAGLPLSGHRRGDEEAYSGSRGLFLVLSKVVEHPKWRYRRIIPVHLLLG
jgi:hypothetical protein